jgi:hypothetical protein
MFTRSRAARPAEFRHLWSVWRERPSGGNGVKQMSAMTDTGTYVYAVSRGGERVAPASLVGVAGTAVRTISSGDLVAYVSTVPLDQFGEEPLRRSLEDLDWLGGTAREHHRVVEAVARTTPTAPVRLVTVYSDEDQVRDLLARRRDDFMAVLSRVTGRKEWGVKAYADPAVFSPSEGDGGDGEEEVRPGTAYLKRRQASLRSREKLRQRVVTQGERIHAALAAFAVASRRHRAQDPQLSGRDEWMVLNGAYLVDEDRGDEFAATVDATVGALRGEGIDVELTGPWAPYSFTTLELDVPEAHGDPR